MKGLIKNILSKLGLLDWFLELENTLRRKSLPAVSKRQWQQRQEELPKLMNQEVKPRYSKIFMIVVDCLRADHLSHLGYHRETTPFIDKLAGQGFSAKRHYATSSWTYPSTISLLTGLYPKNHGGVLPQQRSRRFYHNSENIPLKPDDKVLFLTDYLHQAGFDTYLDAAVLTAGLSLQGRFGEMISRDAEADEVFRRVKNQLDPGQRQFFYLQLGDLHEPVEVLKQKNYRPLGKIKYQSIEKMMRWRFMDGEDLESEEFRGFKENRVKLYDTALRFVDEQISRFVDWLRHQGVLEESLIIITADHGEEFWEHVNWEKRYHPDPRGFYGFGHGQTLFDELTRVPLVVSEDLETKEDVVTSAVDVMGTLCKILNSNIEIRNEVDGLELTKQATAQDRVVFAEEVGYGNEIKTAISASQKAYYLPVENKFFLADTKDREVKASDGSGPLEKKLLNFARNEPKKPTASQKIEDEEKVRKRLENLGYL